MLKYYKVLSMSNYCKLRRFVMFFGVDELVVEFEIVAFLEMIAGS